jgi:hypothetical protein
VNKTTKVTPSSTLRQRLSFGFQPLLLAALALNILNMQLAAANPCLEVQMQCNYELKTTNVALRLTMYLAALAPNVIYTTLDAIFATTVVLTSYCSVYQLY